MEKQLDVGASDIIAIISAFEKLLTLTSYTLEAYDVELLKKTADLIEDRQKRYMVEGNYPRVFLALYKAQRSWSK